MVLNEILNPDDMYYVLRATMRDTGIERLKVGVVVNPLLVQAFCQDKLVNLTQNATT